MFFNIQMDWIILKTYDQQFTSTTKKSLHIIFKQQLVWNWECRDVLQCFSCKTRRKSCYHETEGYTVLVFWFFPTGLNLMPRETGLCQQGPNTANHNIEHNAMQPPTQHSGFVW